jgi:hypothetical protein
MNLIQFLYVIMIYYTSGNRVDIEGKQLINDLLTQSTYPIRIPFLGDVIEAMRKGNDVDYAGLAVALSEFRKEYVANAEAKPAFANMISLFSRWFKSGSSGTYATLTKAASLCDSGYIKNAVKVEKVDQEATTTKLLKVAKDLGFKGRTSLTVDEAKIAKATDPETYKVYLGLRRQFAQAWKAELSDFVRSSGQKTVPYSSADKYLSKKGIEHSMPSGFTGKIDADGNWYTDKDQLISGVPASALFPSVVMNTSGNGDWVFQAIRADGGLGNYFYAKDVVSKKNQDKFEFTGDFIKKLPGYRKKWLANIKSPFDYGSIAAISSVVIELLYLSSQRVGTKVGGNEAGAGFGMASILSKHVTIRENGSFLISYKGKDAVPFKFILNPGSFPDKAICQVMKKLTEGKAPRDPVFTRTLASGNITPVAL